MLGAYRLQPGWEPAFAGVMHQDGTLRAQVVSSSHPEQRFLHRLLLRLWREHGLPGLINTSFNVQGEPMVHGHDAALEAACRMGLDSAVIHGIPHRSRRC